MTRVTRTSVAGVILGWGLACGGVPVADQQAGVVSAPTAAAPDQKPRATTKSSAGKVSKDGTRKKQQRKKKTETDDGEIVWVVVEEWVPLDEWSDEILLVDEFVEVDDVILLEELEDALAEEIALEILEEELLDTGF